MWAPVRSPSLYEHDEPLMAEIARTDQLTERGRLDEVPHLFAEMRMMVTIRARIGQGVELG